MTMSMALVAVPMRRMAMGAPASTLRAAMGEWVAGPRQVACRRSMCHGACSARTRAHAATEGAPCRRIAWPMCSRQSLECEEATFTVAVKKVAHLQATRQTSRESRESQAPATHSLRNQCPALPGYADVDARKSSRQPSAMTRARQWSAEKSHENPP